MNSENAAGDETGDACSVGVVEAAIAPRALVKKTTLIRTLVGLNRPHTGDVALLGL